jgi:hypothetical protein
MRVTGIVIPVTGPGTNVKEHAPSWNCRGILLGLAQVNAGMPPDAVAPLRVPWRYPEVQLRIGSGK